MTVSFQLVADDGEGLEPLHCEPVVVSGMNWPTYHLAVADELAALEAQLNAEAPPP